MQILGALVLVLTVAFGWLAQVVGLAGNWLIVAAVALYAWLMPPEGRGAISFATVGVLLLLAVLGEAAELAAGAMGVAKAGGSRRGALLAIVGSICGGMAGLFVGLPIPVIGSLVAAVLLAGAGALVGAVVGETWKGRDWDASVRVGQAAFVGRLLGTMAKLIASSIMVGMTLASLVL